MSEALTRSVSCDGCKRVQEFTSDKVQAMLNEVGQEGWCTVMSWPFGDDHHSVNAIKRTLCPTCVSFLRLRG